MLTPRPATAESPNLIPRKENAPTGEKSMTKVGGTGPKTAKVEMKKSDPLALIPPFGRLNPAEKGMVMERLVTLVKL